MDELRPGVITYADLLRITAPHGIDNQVMAPCRYNDKALACDLIIITTPFNPSKFYGQQFPGTMDLRCADDGIDQLVRRIAVTIEMTGQKIQAMEYNPVNGWYWPIPGTDRPNPYSVLARPTPPNHAVDIYNSIFDD